ncbi:tRNA (adenosine(37)-N6)-methyltransferase TrmM [Haemophilus paracuniculus]|uniref:tRNA1(Val) (adenine(37)-N6)-methyltransferase n=1 Tax=Haemophilus paracuniculus TaxID=734 RepID=A0A1T0ATA5_9PAST|nr:methyltransferase [Haemophilus paracuniculus]OOR99791.1 tRNA (adenosine(37)-N6)-methyltransferase TrmM [Haemophilus paracuniculus]
MNGFQFKQFFIAHDRCAMKVNTDGILLGAVADVAGARKILDLGTGTGLVAVMLAQRTVSQQSHIFALEIEPNAFKQACENVRNCQWADRISVLQGDVMGEDFPPEMDLIVANPPYFESSLASRTAERDLARCATQSHLAWLEQGKKWLSPTGKITLILPVEAGQKLLSQAETSGLFCVEKWQICTKTGKPPKRYILTFSPTATACVEHRLDIYGADNQYSPAFRELTAAFYLNF